MNQLFEKTITDLAASIAANSTIQNVVMKSFKFYLEWVY